MSGRATRSGIAVVTGCSSGLGAEFARQLATRGWPVLAIARRGDRLRALAQEAVDAGWAPVHPFALDLTELGAAERIAERARALGPIEWLVNNAGVVRIGPFAGSDAGGQTEQVSVNCSVLVGLTGALLPAMLQQSGVARILNIGSLSGFQPMPGLAVYGAAKAFMLSFSEALAEELRGTNVQVSMVCTPPVSSTEMLDSALAASVTRGGMFLEMPASTCVRHAIDAALRGRVLIYIHARDHMLTALIGWSPRALVRRISKVVDLWYLGLPQLKHLPPWRPDRVPDQVGDRK